jgi:hypothetical protein
MNVVTAVNGVHRHVQPACCADAFMPGCTGLFGSLRRHYFAGFAVLKQGNHGHRCSVGRLFVRVVRTSRSCAVSPILLGALAVLVTLSGDIAVIVVNETSMHFNAACFAGIALPTGRLNFSVLDMLH